MVNLPLQIEPSVSANCDCLPAWAVDGEILFLTFRNSVSSHGGQCGIKKIRTDLLLCIKKILYICIPASLIKQLHKFYYGYGLVHNCDKAPSSSNGINKSVIGQEFKLWENSFGVARW